MSGYVLADMGSILGISKDLSLIQLMQLFLGPM